MELKRAAIIAQLVTKLRQSGSWCSETHIQKVLYLMQDLLTSQRHTSLIVFKHEPSSFDLA